MSYLHPAQRARIMALITAKEALLAKANAAYSSALENSEVQNYLIDTGEGKQATSRRKPSEIRIEITALEAEIDGLYNRLGGRGIVCMNLRR